MSKMKKMFNRKARRKLIYKSKVKVGCFIAALSLVALSPAAAQGHMVYAKEQGTQKQAVSENKTRSDKKKDTKDRTDPKQEEKKTETSPTQPAAAQIFRETAVPQAAETEAPGPADDKKEKEEILGEETGIDTDEKTQGPEADGVKAPDTESPAVTPSISDPENGSQGGDTGSTEGDGEEGSVPKQESPAAGGSVQPLPAEDESPGDSQVYVEETEPVPVVGILEGASTIIVGGLAPSVQEGSQGQEQVNKEEEIENEEESDQELQSRIAGSTPLVGGVIAGENTGGSQTKDKTPTAVPSKAPSSGSAAGSRTAATAYPTATSAASSSQQEERVALNDTSTGQQTSSTVRDNPVTGLRQAGVATEDPTKIVPFVLAGVAALAAIVALAVLKIKKGRRDLDSQSGQDQE